MIPRSQFEENLSISQDGVLVSSIEIHVHKGWKNPAISDHSALSPLDPTV